MKSFIADNNEKLSKMLLRKYCGELSFSHLNKLFRKKDIKVNGARVNKDCQVFAGDKVEVYYDGNLCQVVGNFDILFEDENILAIYKHKGITSEYLFKCLQSERENVYFCHRLDRNTDGVMIFAKNQLAYESIYNGFKEKSFEKYYLAEVYGKLQPKKATLTNYILKKPNESKVEIYDTPTSGALKSMLEYEVVEEKQFSSIVKIKLLTGRTHQIRAQLGHKGNFVLGDGKYGNDEISKNLGAYEMKLQCFMLKLHFEGENYLKYLDKKVIKYEK